MEAPQQYEDYWKLTLEYSDIYESNFNNCLRIIINYVDQEQPLLKTNPSEAFQKLQAQLEQTFPKTDSASTRKSINQYIKLGFINVGLLSYHLLAKDFLSEQDHAKKRTLFSKIVYSNSSFGRSFTKQSDIREINFLIKTLEAVGRLSKDDTLALMTVDIAASPTDYLDPDALATARQKAELEAFGERKYNQVNYLWNILRKLDDLAVQNDFLYFESDPRVEIIDETSLKKIGRDGYLQRLYKNQLKEESIAVFDEVVCMVEQLNYPALIASHIKPYIQSSEEEKFDVNNGLLLSLNMDALFDQGYITFDETGQIIITRSKNFSEALVTYLQAHSLDSPLLNAQRKQYLSYHRSKVFQP